MHRNHHRPGAGRHPARTLLAAAALTAGPAVALAGSSFTSGTATWTWDADTNSALIGKTTFSVAPAPSSALSPSSYQLDRSGTSGTASASGKGAIGYVANSTTATFTLASGTGAAQNDPSNILTGTTLTRVAVDGYFTATSPSFGPTATGYLSLTVAGTAGIGGYTSVTGDFSYKLTNSSGANLRAPISFTDTFLGGVSGSTFSKTYTYSAPFSPASLAPGQVVYVSGTLTFQASNLGSPSDVAPVSFEAGNAPPTSAYYGGPSSDWSDVTAWTPPENAAANVFSFNETAPVVPNAIGARAKFVSRGVAEQVVNTSQTITIGTLHFDTDGGISVNGGNGGEFGELDFDVASGKAQVYVGSSAGRKVHELNIVTKLQDDLDILTTGTPDGPSGIAFNGNIIESDGPKSITVRGNGVAYFNSANGYSGGTLITDGGTLVAGFDASLGSGPVTINNGTLIIANPNAVPAGTVVTVQSGGQATIGFTPIIPGVGPVYSIAAGGAIVGNATRLGELTVGSNLLLAPGAIVGHETFDTGPAGNPANIGTTPQYFFGIVNDFTDLATAPISVGTGTTSPWKGFAGLNQAVTYGAGPSDSGTAAINVVGDAVLFAGKRLTLNAPVNGGSTSTVTIAGGGTVVLASFVNGFTGSVVVSGGSTLIVTGNLNGPGSFAGGAIAPSLVVNGGGTLGGNGQINRNVILAPDAILSPGDATPGSLTGALAIIGNVTLSPTTKLKFDFADTNDRVDVAGDLVLDGVLSITQTQDFDALQYVLFTYTGTLTDNGLLLDPENAPIFEGGGSASIVVVPNLGGGGTVYLSVLAVPEPGTAGLAVAAAGLLARRRRR
jgi:hypothetical protein